MVPTRTKKLIIIARMNFFKMQIDFFQKPICILKKEWKSCQISPPVFEVHDIAGCHQSDKIRTNVMIILFIEIIDIKIETAKFIGKNTSILLLHFVKRFITAGSINV